MDLATLYAPEVEFARTFAQRLHDHPQKFDGVQYESRHTQTLCLALWPTYSPALRTIGLERGESLWELAQFSKTLPPGCLELFGTALDVAAVAPTPV